MSRLTNTSPTPPKLLNARRWRGMRIGILGGSFNPPHAGHVHNSEVALKYLGLDAVWWLVTPGNPLKQNAGLPSVAQRVAQCRALITHPRMVVCDLEQDLGTFRSFDTVKLLKQKFRGAEFIWLGGSEIAREFPRWHRARELMHELPFAFIARPTSAGLTNGNAGNQGARGRGDRADHSAIIKPTVFHRHKLIRNHVLTHGGRPKLESGHVYWLFHELRSPLSSTYLRSRSE